tara:strand:+ start:192 stop:1256 length:1065 start_codon:yes stop_codon:yes gene_type:complete
MGIITQGDLANCDIQNHKSTEFEGNTTTGIPMFGLPNVVLISIGSGFDGTPPPDSETGEGFWWVNADNFNIGGVPDIYPIIPANKWATTSGDYPLYNIGFGTDVYPPNINQVSQDYIFGIGVGNDASEITNFNPLSWYTSPGGTTWDEFDYIPPSGETLTVDPDTGNSPYFAPGPVLQENAIATPGKYYAAWTMSNAVDNNGISISEQAEANWDYRVRDIMICNEGGPVVGMSNSAKNKNRVLVWVRLKDDWVYPNGSLTINVDINGYREWVDVVPFTPGSDRRLKKNIKLIGKSLSGLKIYSFEYIDKKFGDGFYQGVMSDEIPQRAVIKHEDGYDRVNYSKIDVDFKRVNYG